MHKQYHSETCSPLWKPTDCCRKITAPVPTGIPISNQRPTGPKADLICVLKVLKTVHSLMSTYFPNATTQYSIGRPYMPIINLFKVLTTGPCITYKYTKPQLSIRQLSSDTGTYYRPMEQSCAHWATWIQNKEALQIGGEDGLGNQRHWLLQLVYSHGKWFPTSYPHTNKFHVDQT